MKRRLSKGLIKRVALQLRKMPFYSVRHGRKPGVYTTWEECRQQINGFKGARFKKFDTKDEAGAFAAAKNDITFTALKEAGYGGVSNNYPTLPPYFVPEKRKMGEREDKESNGKHATVYTDGSCEGNGRTGAKGGLGVFWGENHPNNISEPLYGRQTNNRAEIEAACRAIDQAAEQGYERITVLTDSKFMIQSMEEWVPKWEKNGWVTSTGKPIANKEDFQKLRLSSSKIKVELKHVPGHAGVEGNEQADRLAREGSAQNNKRIKLE